MFIYSQSLFKLHVLNKYWVKITSTPHLPSIFLFCFLLCILFLSSPSIHFLVISLPSFSASVFLSPSIQSANDSACADEMDGVSIFRTREGGQIKSKLEREREGGREKEEGCEEKINLHSTAASGQRHLEPHSALGEAASLAGD